MTEFRSRNAEVVAISVDPTETSLGIARAYGIEFPILSDPALVAIDGFGVRHRDGDPVEGGDIARPATFVLDREGRVAWRQLSDNWRIRPRPDQLLAVLDGLP